MGRKIVWSSDDEDFPSLDDLRAARVAIVKDTNNPVTPASSVRLRKLTANHHHDNPLLRRLETKDSAGTIGLCSGGPLRRPLPRGEAKRSKKVVCSSEEEESEEANTEEVDSSFTNDASSVHSSNLASSPLQKAAAADLILDTRNREAAVAHTPTALNAPNTPEREKRERRLGSLKKQPGIPKTPHRPSLDIFWSREFVDEWNEEHSPVKKLAFTSPKKGAVRSETRVDKAKTQVGQKLQPDHRAKKAFESRKAELARSFLGELDTVITDGKLGELARSTGGIKLNWTNKLNTTAGRASWKRETVRTATETGVDVQHKHHASIDLAEKVIDDETRLLNVIAHEFCHLANFMVSGVTGNPHGKEFKAWAAKCSRAFADRSIQVTTKHTYEIDFKYVWRCTDCCVEYKRHSKSINPERHRCGSCKSTLQQIKPKPRAQTKESDYQRFMREQMKIVKADNPGSPQKDVMRIIAEQWARKRPAKTDAAGVDAAGADLPKTEDIVGQLDMLTLES
jgi:predicted SprT family Zn-dependent metalloprotease